MARYRKSSSLELMAGALRLYEVAVQKYSVRGEDLATHPIDSRGIHLAPQIVKGPRRYNRADRVLRLRRPILTNKICLRESNARRISRESRGRDFEHRTREVDSLIGDVRDPLKQACGEITRPDAELDNVPTGQSRFTETSDDGVEEPETFGGWSKSVRPTSSVRFVMEFVLRTYKNTAISGIRNRRRGVFGPETLSLPYRHGRT